MTSTAAFSLFTAPWLASAVGTHMSKSIYVTAVGSPKGGSNKIKTCNNLPPFCYWMRITRYFTCSTDISVFNNNNNNKKKPIQKHGLFIYDLKLDRGDFLVANFGVWNVELDTGIALPEEFSCELLYIKLFLLTEFCLSWLLLSSAEVLLLF